MQVNTTILPSMISEARRAIYNLASFPESRKDVRISSDLKTTIVAQGRFKKLLASLTCDTCFSRKRYDNNTSLERAHDAFREKIRVLHQSGALTKDLDLQHACEDAQKVFNAAVDRCSKHRNSELRIKIDLQQLIQEFSSLTQVPQSPIRPLYPRQKNNWIDYQTLLKL